MCCPAQTLIEDRRGSGIGRLMQRPDVAAMVLILVFGAFANAAGMTEPVMMWMHHLHALEQARLGLSSMVPIVSALYACGLLIIPAILAAACGWASLHWARASAGRKELTYGFTLALVPLGFSMWLAHFSKHLVAGWSALVPAVERFFSRVSSGVYAQAWVPVWMLSVDLLFLDLGLLLTLYVAWRVARQATDGKRNAAAVLAPWAVLAGALYSAGVWIVFQPMQMRGTMMMR